LAFEKKSLDAWKTAFDSIYSRKNMALSLNSILLRLVEETAELVMPVITVNPSNIEYGLPDVLAWICAFANKSGLSVNKSMEAKYLQKPPGKDQASISVYSILGKDRPETLGDWQKYLGFVYAEENRSHGPFYILTLLVEDVGTASHKHRTGSGPEEVMDRLCGTLAWSIALANHFKIDLSEAAWKKYPALCVHCNQTECRCSSLTRIFIGYVSDTESFVPSAQKVISELLLSHISFPDIRAFQKPRMVEIFNAINGSDGGVVILATKFSPRVYAELLEMLRVMDGDNVWIFVRDKSGRDKDQQLAEVIRDLEHFYQIYDFDGESDFEGKLRDMVRKRLGEIRAMRQR